MMDLNDESIHDYDILLDDEDEMMTDAQGNETAKKGEKDGDKKEEKEGEKERKESADSTGSYEVVDREKVTSETWEVNYTAFVYDDKKGEQVEVDIMCNTGDEIRLIRS